MTTLFGKPVFEVDLNLPDEPVILFADALVALAGKLINEHRDNDRVIVNRRAFSEIQWIANRTALRRIYRKLGHPFGQNDGAFKRWVLTRPAEFWAEQESEL